MQAGRSDSDEDDDPTPPTRSYVDALLHGDLSPDQLASLRAEMAGNAAEELLGLQVPPSSSARLRPSSEPAVPASLPASAPRLRPSVPPPSAGLRSMPPMPSSRPPFPTPRPPSSRSPGSHGTAGRRGASSYPPSGPTRIGEAGVGSSPPSSRGFGERVGPPSSRGFGGLSSSIAWPHPDVDARYQDARGQDRDEGDVVFDAIYLAALGGTANVPRLALPATRVTELPLGPQAAFVLSRIDGVSSIEDVLDISGLSRTETLRILYDLFEQGIIRIQTG